MGKVMIIDLALCNGCHNCQIACKDEHVGNDWSPIAKPQPDTGQFWHKVVNMERGTFPKVHVTYHHTMCLHCDDAPCIAACREQAIYRRPDGIVVIDPQRCKGNKLCMEACPYENVIYFNTDLNIAQKCTMCAHLIDQGWTDTRCSDVCPTGALTFGDEGDPQIQALVAQAGLPTPALSYRPRVYYRNLPQKWIAGAVYDPEADRCSEGATVTGVNVQTGEETTVTTDNYGDFWLRGLADGAYVLQIEKPGYLTIRLGPIDVTDRDRNLGDITLWRESRDA